MATKIILSKIETCKLCGKNKSKDLPCECYEVSTYKQKNLVNHPPHYNNSSAKCTECGKTIECIDVVRHLNFNLGNAIKYIWRADHKGNKVEDLKKAIWYLEDEIQKNLREVK